MTFPIFLVWLSRADIMPVESRFLVRPEARKLFDNFKRKQKIFALMVPLRKFFMSIVLVLFKSSPTMQISLLLFLCMIQLGLLIHLQPLKTRMQNILRIISELSFLLAHTILLVFPRLERRLSVEHVKILGWSSAGLFVIAFLFELITIYYSKLKGKKKGDKPKESPDQ